MCILLTLQPRLSQYIYRILEMMMSSDRSNKEVFLYKAHSTDGSSIYRLLYPYGSIEPYIVYKKCLEMKYCSEYDGY